MTNIALAALTPVTLTNTRAVKFQNVGSGFLAYQGWHDDFYNFMFRLATPPLDAAYLILSR